MNDENLHFRKHTRLKEFNYSSDGAYFITICTKDRASIINDPFKIIIEEELRDIERRFLGVKLDYFVIMDDHIHFILIFMDSKTGLSKVVQAFKSISTLKLKRAGYQKQRFWQPNYYEHVVRDEKSLNKVRKYIIENPLAEQLNWKEIEK